jgi:hypothetical protein
MDELLSLSLLFFCINPSLFRDLTLQKKKKRFLPLKNKLLHGAAASAQITDTKLFIFPPAPKWNPPPKQRPRRVTRIRAHARARVTHTRKQNKITTTTSEAPPLQLSNDATGTSATAACNPRPPPPPNPKGARLRHQDFASHLPLRPASLLHFSNVIPSASSRTDSYSAVER